MRAWNLDFRKRGICIRKMFKLDSFGGKKKISISIPENLPIPFSSLFFFLWKLANFFFFFLSLPLFSIPLEISQSYWKNVQTYSKTKFQHLTWTFSVYNTTCNLNRSRYPTQFFLLLLLLKKKKKKKKSKGQDEQLSMENLGGLKFYMARVDSNVNPLDLGTTESHSPAACSCIEPSGPRARSSPNVKVAARSVTERPGPVLLPGENLFSSIPPPLSPFSSLLAMR